MAANRYSKKCKLFLAVMVFVMLPLGPAIWAPGMQCWRWEQPPNCHYFSVVGGGL